MQNFSFNQSAGITFKSIIMCLVLLIPVFVQSASAEAAIRPVVIEGEAVPGFDAGYRFGDFNSSALISINNAGQTAFIGTVESGSTYYRTLWRERNRTMSLMQQSGDLPPGTSGDVAFQTFYHPNINDSGMVAFIAFLTGNDVENPENSTGVWKGSPGSVSLVARAGDMVPGNSGDTLGNNFSAWSGNTVLLNNSGKVAFKNNLNRSPYTSILHETASGLTLIAKNGMPVPGIIDAVYSHLPTPTLSLNDSGNLPFPAFISCNSGFCLDWVDDLKGADIFQMSADGNVSTKYKAYTSAPGIPGGDLASLSSSAPDINASGKVAFDAPVSGENINFSNNQALWTDASGALSLIARKGSQAPNAPTGAVFDSFSRIEINNAGQVAFKAVLKAGTGDLDSTNNEGLWFGTPGNLKLIARSGDQAPGAENGIVFSSFSHYTINNSGQVCIIASVMSSVNYVGIWLYDPSDGLSLLVQEGDDVTLTSGETVTFDDIYYYAAGTTFSGGADGRARFFNDAGEIVFGSTLSDLRSGLFIVNTDDSGFNIVANIKAKGSDGPINISSIDNLSITIALTPKEFMGDNADWWLVAATPFGLFHYQPESNSWAPDLTYSHQGPLFNLGEFEVLNIAGLPVGSYTVYFGVDMDMNGILDMDQAYYDSVTVNVQ